MIERIFGVPWLGDPSAAEGGLGRRTIGRAARIGLILAPSVAIVLVGLLAGRGGTAFTIGYGLAVAVLAVSFVLLRRAPIAITASLLVWLSVQRFAVAALSPGLGASQLRALLAYKELFFPGLAIILALGLIPLLKARGRTLVWPDVLAVAFGALIFVALILSPASLQDRVLYARRLAYLPLVYLVARMLPWRRATVNAAVVLVIVAGLGLSLFGFAERFLIAEPLWRQLVPAAYYYHLSGLAELNTPGTDFPIGGIPIVFFDFTTGHAVRRLVSTFLEATTLATFLSFASLMAFAIGRPTTRSLAVAFTIALAAYLTLSKAGIAILDVGLAYLALILVIRRFRDPAWLLSAAAWLLGALVIVAIGLAASGATTGALAHFRGLKQGIESAVGAPLGIGLGTGGGFAGSLVGSESSFGVILVQLGFPGLALWSAWLIGVAYVCAGWRGRRGASGMIGPAVGVALIAFLGTASLTESAGGLLGNWIYAFVAGALVTSGMATPLEPEAVRSPRVRIAEVDIDAITFDAAVAWIVDRARSRSGGVACTPNADYVVRAHRDPAFRAAIAAADLRVPDGMAIVYAARLAGLSVPGTVTGRRLLPAVAAIAAVEGWPIALYGAGPGIADRAAAALRGAYPGLKVTAAISPPMDLRLGPDDNQADIRALVASGARVVFLALGAPKQEAWMARYRAQLDGIVLVGVGAAFDIVSGRFRVAPAWMTTVGLEWLFRLVQEPRRLARRYLIDDPWIFWWALRTGLGRRPVTAATATATDAGTWRTPS